MERAANKMRLAEHRARAEMERARARFETELEEARARLHRSLSDFATGHPALGGKAPDNGDTRDEFAAITAAFRKGLEEARSGFAGGRDSAPDHSSQDSSLLGQELQRVLQQLGEARQELKEARSKHFTGPRAGKKIGPLKDRIERLVMEAIRNPPRKGRRRGLDDGGLPAPVKPRPNPTPLVDGAEAPIE
jgi:ElaB/YqjD/DUF883 family membrane-anchored ribosome-binding protein